VIDETVYGRHNYNNKMSESDVLAYESVKRNSPSICWTLQ